MKRIYRNEHRLIVGNIKNILEANGIMVIWNNEFTQSGVGETSPLDSWPELWVLNDADYERAVELIEDSLSPENAPEWACGLCGETNDASFDICWNCQNGKP